MKRKREGDQGGVHLKLRKTASGKWQGGRVDEEKKWLVGGQ